MADNMQAQQALGAIYARSQSMVSRRIAGETVLLPIHTEPHTTPCIYTMNGVAAFVWERIDGAHRGLDLVEEVLEEFEVDRLEAATDVLAFVEQLVDVGAIAVVT